MTILNIVKGRSIKKATPACGDSVGQIAWTRNVAATLMHRLLACCRLGDVVMIAAIMVSLSACSTDPVDDPIPPVSFPDKVINLNLPDNIGLRSKGTSKAYNDIGLRGVIVYCLDAGVYHAYERTCSFQPNEACATVNIDVSTLFMVDHCCGSMFDFHTGMPSGGAAWRPLRQYRTIISGSDLVITDEIVE